MTMKVLPVSPLIYRGSRPEKEADVAWLKGMRGVTRVINLQGFLAEHHQVEEEKSWAANVGVEFTHLLWNLVTPPGANDIQSVLSLMTSPTAPVYVHCHDGVDRTGVACLAYRLCCGVSFGTAVGEMIDTGFHLDHYFWWLPFLAPRAGQAGVGFVNRTVRKGEL